MGENLYPCTLLQERLWRRVQSGRPYGLNVAMRWLVTGPLSPQTVQRALQVMVRRHEILRTYFREIDGVPRQVILADLPVRLRSLDLSTLGFDAARTRADEIARDEAMELMDLDTAPLFRTGLLRLGPDRAVLLLTFHAMIADGWSMGLLIREFEAAARAIEAGSAPDDSAPDLQVVDYALWERELLASGALEDSRHYWQRKMRGVVGTTVPADHEPPDPAGGRLGDHSDIVSFLLAPPLTVAVETFANRHGFTFYALAAAALALLLHRTTGERKIVIGSAVAHRDDPVAEKLAGPTVNTATLCLPVDDQVSPLTFARIAADEVQEALHHQRLPFEAVAASLDDDGRHLHAINLVVHRAFSNVAPRPADAGGFSLQALPSFPSGAQWDLNFFLIWRDEGWRMSCEFDGELYDEPTARSLLDGWQLCLETLVTSPEARLVDCPALDGIRLRGRPKPASPSPAIVRRTGHEPIPLHDPDRQIARFHDGGDKTPMIALNNRSVYYQLARAMGGDRPFIDIQVYHPEGPIDLSDYSFDDFATYAVRLIRATQPNGPYLLGGHCVYGALAFEAARQLLRSGEEVELVALFDTWAPGYRESMPPRDQERRRRQLRANAHRHRIEQYGKGKIGLKDLVWLPIARRLGYHEDETEPTEANLFTGRWFDDYIRIAASHHRPAPLNVDAVLFRSTEPLHGALFDERMGWGSVVAGKLYQANVDSGHLDMFQEKPAAEIAAFLDPLLGGIEGRRHRG